MRVKTSTRMMRLIIRARDWFARVTGFGIFRFPLSYSVEAELARIISSNHVSLVVDVGAHRGEFGTRLRRSGYRGRLLSFEPGPEFDHLKKLASRDHNWDIVNAACGSTAGSQILNIMKSSDFNSIRTPRGAKGAFSSSLEIINSQNVMVVRLDQVLHEFMRPNDVVLIKSDTQGYDLEVLLGSVGVFEHVAAVLVETSAIPIYENAPVIENSLSFLRKHGFVFAGAFPVSRPNIVVEFDCLAVRPPS